MEVPDWPMGSGAAGTLHRCVSYDLVDDFYCGNDHLAEFLRTGDRRCLLLPYVAVAVA